MELIKRPPEEKSPAKEKDPLMHIRNKRRGKAVQKRLVNRMGGKNVGTVEGQDGEHPLFSIEVKSRMKNLVDNYMDQAVTNCPRGKRPLVMIHTIGKHKNHDLMMVRWKDWEELILPLIDNTLEMSNPLLLQKIKNREDMINALLEFIPEGWEMPLGFNQLVKQIKKELKGKG